MRASNGSAMRRLRDSIVVVMLACACPQAGAETLRAFAERHGLSATLRQWWIERLRGGAASARMEAAKALGAEGALFQADASLDARTRSELLRQVVAALPPADPSSVRPRLEVARQDLGLAASRIDVLRGDPSDAAALREALEALGRVEDALRPVLARLGESGGDRELGSALREPAQLLEAWRFTLRSWIDRRVPGRARDRRAGDVQLARAIVEFGRLIDVESESPQPAEASQDLLKTELGAEAALGLAVAARMQDRPDLAEAWLQAIEASAPGSDAMRRVPMWRLGFAIDARDTAAIRAAIERMPARALPSALALSAARAASSTSGPDAGAVVAAAMAAMDASARSEWLLGLESGNGPLRTLAQALRVADRDLERWQRGESDGAAAAAELLSRGIQEAGTSAPSPIRAEALRAMGWAHRAAGSAAQASAAFEAAAGAGEAFAPECLWLAAVSATAPDEAGRARRLDLLSRQRARDPKGPFAGRVAAWLSRMDGLGADPLAIAVLLDVPSTDPFLADARCEAARRILAGAGSDAAAAAEAGRRALRALEPVVQSPDAARWRLLAAVSAFEAATARQAATALRAEDRQDPTVRAMLVRLHALEGDAPGVRALLAGMSGPDATRAALAASFSLAGVAGPEATIAAVDLALLAADSPDAELRAVARDRAARALLRACDDGVILPPELAARAATTLATGRSESRVQELAAAEALRASGRDAEAIDRLQRIGAGLVQGSEPWAEARWRLWRALSATDPERAHRMLEQHLALMPDGGPAPWGPRLLKAAGGGSR